MARRDQKIETYTAGCGQGGGGEWSIKLILKKNWA